MADNQELLDQMEKLLHEIADAESKLRDLQEAHKAIDIHIETLQNQASDLSMEVMSYVNAGD